MAPVGGVGRRTAVNDLSVIFRVPLPSYPRMQPFLRAGFENLDSDEIDEPTILGGQLANGVSMPSYNPQDVWDHQNYYISLGLGHARRVSREFEIGADVAAGMSQSYYSQRVVSVDGNWYPVGNPGVIITAGGKLTLNPSYNFSIDLTPVLRYRKSLGGIPDFDGFYFGAGFAAHYRFGQDPDSPPSEIRALRIGDIVMPPVFASMQSVYVREPITRVLVTNGEKSDISDLEVIFNQPAMMDSPTLSFRLDRLGPGESVEVPVTASFSRDVFFTNGITPLNGELIFRYSYRGRTASQTQGIPFDLYDRNALTWDDDRKVSAFITPSDSAIGNYASFIRTSARKEATDYLPHELEYAMQVYHALAHLGLLYQPDPSSPFAEVQGNTLVVDSVSLPRETLKNITGDCDDITVLFASLMETVGVPTGIITIPGHIYVAVNTRLSPREYGRVHPDRSMTIVQDGTLWILLEITMIGREGFMEAWRTGMEQWRAYDQRVEDRGFFITAEAQQQYRPVGLTETDLGLQYGNPEGFLQPYRSDLNRLSSQILSPLRERAEAANTARHWNSLGVAAARLNQHQTARSAFQQAARRDPGDPAPQINLGSLAFVQDDYRTALASFQRAEELIDRWPGTSGARVVVFSNLVKTLQALENHDQAAIYVRRLEAIDPEAANRFAGVAETSRGGSRAASADTGPGIIFWEEGDVP